MTPEQLKDRGEAGWIVGPGETEEAFVKRIDIQESFLKTPSSKKEKMKISTLEPLDKTPEVMRILKEKLHVAPSWILIGYSNRCLCLWEGAASWTSEWGNWIQLRKAFRKGRFLFYDKEEVILHEALHSLRHAFDEPQFEEILANAFTKKKWRRFFSPLFAVPRQAHIFLITLFLLPFAPYVPLAYLLWRIKCLIKNQKTFKQALSKIKRLFPHISPYSVIVRLTDKEIQLFANQDQKGIKEYLESQKHDLRMHQLSFLTAF